ncbi:AimR family lysis-lysogeny pheromone receptor, partial [Bacillus sp. HC-Mk]
EKTRKNSKKHLQKEFKHNLMKELMKKIKQDMDDKGFKIRPLAKKVGVDRSVITDGIVTGKTAEMKLDAFMRIMDVIYENSVSLLAVLLNFHRQHP